MKKTLVIGSSVCDVIIRLHRIPQVSGDENIIHQELSIEMCIRDRRQTATKTVS